MALQFPSASVGQRYQSGSSATYEWNGSYWVVVQPASLTVLNSKSASLAETASFALNGGGGGGDSVSASWASSSISASYALTASFLEGGIESSSYASSSISASYALTASNVETSSFTFTASLAHTASNAYNFTVDNNLTVKGVLSASFLYADSSSVIFTSGSNVFGTELSNTQALTGSVGITGSLVLNGSTPANIPNLTGSLFGSASYANNSNTASLSITASYVVTAQTASFITASNVSGIVTSASIATTASYIQTAQTASFVTASNVSGIVAAAYTASFVNALTQTVGITGSLSVTNTVAGATGSFAHILAPGSSSLGHVAVLNNLTVSGTVDVFAGGNVELQVRNTGVRLGNQQADNHLVTGSFGITGSLRVVGGGITGSLLGTATTATTTTLAYASILFSGFPNFAGADITPVLGLGAGITVSGNTIILANPGVYQVRADLGIRCTFAEYAFADASNVRYPGTNVALCGSVNSVDPTSVSSAGGIIVTTAANTIVKLRLINVGGFNPFQFPAAAGAQIIQIR